MNYYKIPVWFFYRYSLFIRGTGFLFSTFRKNLHHKIIAVQLIAKISTFA